MKSIDTKSRNSNLSDSPIFIIGPHRSGTSFLAYLLKQHPNLTYVGEPLHIWNWGNKNKDNDRLLESDVAEKIDINIKKQFNKILDNSTGLQILEKTPTNCLRIPFINKIYPDAKIILLVRDGRAVIRSTIKMLNAPPVSLKRSVWARMKTTPIYRWPHYLNKFNFFVTRLSNRPPTYWGPRPPMWQSWVKDGDTETMLAKQWVSMVNTAFDDLESLGINYHIVKYEELVTNPSDSIQKIMRYCGLQYSREVMDYILANADNSKVNCWKDELTEELLVKLQPIMQSTNEKFGYKW